MEHASAISGYHIREAGSTAVQELAFTLADGFHYVDICLDRGLDDRRLRAAAELLLQRPQRHLRGDRQVPGGPRPVGRRHAQQVRRHARRRRGSCASTPRRPAVRLQDKQPEVNLIRVAYQALAAVLGGCQSLHTNSMDETLALPSEHAVTLALRTQQVLAYETGVTNTVDPLGGSYFVETLTKQMQQQARSLLRPHRGAGRHDRGAGGGLLPPRDRRRRLRLPARGGRQAQADRRRQRLPGGGREADRNAGDRRRRWRRSRSAGCSERKAKRDGEAVRRLLDEVRRVAATKENLMPALIEAARARCTVGEIMNALADVFGRYDGAAKW